MIVFDRLICIYHSFDRDTELGLYFKLLDMTCGRNTEVFNGIGGLF